jgi:HPt (histidine-containing phosphotransfer) domain-containing protein
MRNIEGFQQEHLIERESLPEPQPVLDPTPLRSLRALETVAGPGFLEDVVGTFLESVPRSLTALRDAATRGDSAAVERLAHSLRGSCGIVGARRLASRAASIERAAWAPEDEAAEDFRGLDAEWNAVESALADACRNGRSVH